MNQNERGTMRKRHDRVQGGSAPNAGSRAFLHLSEGNELAAEGPSVARKAVVAILAALFILAVPLIWANSAIGGGDDRAVREYAKGPGHDGDDDDDDNSGPGGGTDDSSASSLTTGTGSRDSALTTGTTRNTNDSTDDANSKRTKGTGTKDSARTADTTRVTTGQSTDDSNSAKTRGTGSRDSARTAGTTKGTRG